MIVLLYVILLEESSGERTMKESANNFSATVNMLFKVLGNDLLPKERVETVIEVQKN